MQSSVKQKSERLNHSVDQNINCKNIQAPTKWKKEYVCMFNEEVGIKNDSYTVLLEQCT